MTRMKRDQIYVKNRKKLLKEYNALLVERIKLNKKLRQVSREMEQLDRYLLED